MLIQGINDEFPGRGPDVGAFEFGAEAKGISFDQNGSVTDWRVGAFGTFQLQYTTDLTQSVWKPLGVPLLAERPNLRFRDPPPADTQRFYRLQRVAP